MPNPITYSFFHLLNIGCESMCGYTPTNLCSMFYHNSSWQIRVLWSSSRIHRLSCSDVRTRHATPPRTRRLSHPRFLCSQERNYYTSLVINKGTSDPICHDHGMDSLCLISTHLLGSPRQNIYEFIYGIWMPLELPLVVLLTTRNLSKVERVKHSIV